MSGYHTHRPETLDQCKGQSRLKTALKNKVSAFQSSGRCSGHLLFTGPSGTGKTTFARCYAAEMGVGFHYEMATNIKTWVQFLQLVLSSEENDVIFIDEIHALPSAVQEAIYPIIEDFQYVADDRDGKRATFGVHQFTLVGATTHAGDLNAAFKTRFLPPFRLSAYNEEDLTQMVLSASQRVYGVSSSDGMSKVAQMIAGLCRKTPRIAYNLLGDVMDTASARIGHCPTENDITANLLVGDEAGGEGVLFLQSLDPFVGLNLSSRAYLSALSRNKTLGERALAAMIREELSTLKNDIEPFLLTDVSLPLGSGRSAVGPFVEITSQGRAITEFGLLYLDLCRDLQIERGWFEDEKL